MKTMVHCPSCSARLSASKKLAGKKIKCPKCQKPFKVPADEGELVDDTIACWLEMDHEKAEKAKPAAMPAKLDDLHDDFHSPELNHLELSLGEEPMKLHPKADGAADTAHEDDLPTPDLSLDPTAHSVHGSPDEPDDAPQPTGTPASLTVGSATDTAVDAPIRLAVLEASAGGVLLAFDARLLARWSFRASMPMRCAGCGDPDPERLTAHPVIWLNRLKDEKISPQFLAGRHQMRVAGVEDTRRVLDGLGVVEELHEPYQQSMPYYLCRPCAPRVHVEAETRPANPAAPGTAAENCIVFIPHAQLAIEWLGRVNGFCGDDYLALRAACAVPAGQAPPAPPPADDALSVLSESVRKNLAEWHKPSAGEKFVLFLKDTDYPPGDSGRGGVVLTDHRLAYNKYHKSGSVLLNDEGTKLVALRHGAFDDLIVDHEGMRNKLVKLRHADSELLAEALEDLPCRLKLDMEEAPATESAA